MGKLLLLASVIFLFTHCGDGQETDSEECFIECPYPYTQPLYFKIINQDSVDLLFDTTYFDLDEIRLYDHIANHAVHLSIERSKGINFLQAVLSEEGPYQLSLNDSLDIALDIFFVLTNDPTNPAECTCQNYYIEEIYANDEVLCKECYNEDIHYLIINVDL